MSCIGLVTREIMDNRDKDFGHMGSRKLWILHRKTYITRNDVKPALKIIQQCEICQIAKNKNVGKSVVARNYLDGVAIDFISNLNKTRAGFQHIYQNF